MLRMMNIEQNIYRMYRSIVETFVDATANNHVFGDGCVCLRFTFSTQLDVHLAVFFHLTEYMYLNLYTGPWCILNEFHRTQPFIITLTLPRYD